MLIIGIGGGTGSGKTTVVNQIISEFPKGEVQVISQDSYYKDTSHLTFEERCKINFDHPQSIDFELLLIKLDDNIFIHHSLFSVSHLCTVLLNFSGCSIIGA